MRCGVWPDDVSSLLAMNGSQTYMDCMQVVMQYTIRVQTYPKMELKIYNVLNSSHDMVISFNSCYF